MGLDEGGAVPTLVHTVFVVRLKLQKNRLYYCVASHYSLY